MFPARERGSRKGGPNNREPCEDDVDDENDDPDIHIGDDIDNDQGVMVSLLPLPLFSYCARYGAIREELQFLHARLVRGIRPPRPSP